MPLPSVKAATGELPLEARAWKPGGISVTASPWLIHTGSSPLNPSNSGAVLVGLPWVDLAAEVVRDELHAIADAQHRDSRAERFRIDLRRAGLVDAGGAAAEDEPCWIALLQLRPGRRPGH